MTRLEQVPLQLLVPVCKVQVGLDGRLRSVLSVLSLSLGRRLLP